MKKMRLMAFSVVAMCFVAVSDAFSANYILGVGDLSWPNAAAWTNPGNGDKSAQHPAAPYEYHRGIGLQLNSSTNAVRLSDAPMYAMNPADKADVDGIPDYCEFPYRSATGLVASADNDGDEFSNLQECSANTNPVRGSGAGSPITVTNTSRQIFCRLYVRVTEWQ